MEHADGLIDAVHTRVVINGECLVVCQTCEGWLRVVRSRRKRVAKIEDTLIEERHLHIGMRIVEVDRGLECATRHRHTRACREVCLHVVAKVETQDEEFAISRREGEACRVEVDHGGTCGGKRVHRRLEGVEHRLWRRYVRIESI